MATIELRLSNKVSRETGMSEIMITFRYSKHDLSAKSGVFVNPAFFEYYIDRKKTKNPKRPLPENKTTATMEKASRNGWMLRKSGIIVTSAKALPTPEVNYHNEQAARMEDLKKSIVTAYNDAQDKENLTSEWLIGIVEQFNHPEKYQVKEKSFYELMDEYLAKPHGKMATLVSKQTIKLYHVLARAAARYEGFTHETDVTRKTWTWNNLDNITKEDLEDFFDYLRNEAELAEEHPILFKKLLENYPASTRPKQEGKIGKRGDNTLCEMKARLKAFFNYLYKQGHMRNRPFEGMTIGTTTAGTPVYITIDERNKIANADLAAAWEKLTDDVRKKPRVTLKTLIEQRDIFIFQCFIGCRVSDLLRLTSNNIENGILKYTAQKTKNSSQVQPTVPLHEKAAALVEKYKGTDPKGRLFPFICTQRYNAAIKLIFRMAGITRQVEIRNPLTGENEFVSIADIATSHMARRTFCGNLYFKVQDPNLIGKMSGHVDGSRAFARYRKIEDETLKNVINLIG